MIFDNENDNLMRRTLTLLLFLLALLAIYFILDRADNSDGSIQIEDREFVIEDPGEVAFITVKNPGYPMMHFKRKSQNQWLLNDKYYADMNIVNNMLGVLSTMKINYIPPRSMMPKIMGELDEVGIEIKAFDSDGNILSDFIMASNDNKELSTFCVKRGARQAYAMHVPVAEGGLRNYFNQPQRDLRDKAIFNIDHRNIEELNLIYFKDRKNSFGVKRKNGQLQLRSLERLNTKAINTNQKTIQSYIKDYDKVMAEAIRTGEVSVDSIKNMIPFAQINYTLKDSSTSSFDFYPMVDIFLDTVNTQTYKDLSAVERYFVFDNNEEIYIVQQRMVGQFFKPIDYFMK